MDKIPDRIPRTHMAWALDGPDWSSRQSELTSLWANSIRKNHVAGLRIFQDVSVVESDDNLPDWAYLCVAELRADVDYRDALDGVDRLQSETDRTISQVRLETMSETTNSFHPGIDADVYTIEYIDVKSECADDYRDSMAINSGPAMNKMIELGEINSFEAFETNHLVPVGNAMPSWNQIHIVGLAHNDMARVLSKLNECLEAVNPQGGGFEGVFGRLDNMRARRKTSMARLVLSTGTNPTRL